MPDADYLATRRSTIFATESRFKIKEESQATWEAYRKKTFRYLPFVR